ncbi:cytochrome d ubiquinol oxidase subunit II [Mesorhizobium sp. M2E.F.Ca.ET.219.01.1.1]|nr:cytochrome d ubiquinol oxidase subunit II [Mesorhizobium sp. M2E.F.Ca.ET.219.01.1.1]
MTMDLPLIFALVAAGAVGLYVLADGFDLGIGLLFLLAPREQDRDLMMESISPIWDGNETWLVFGGALLWTAFPIAYYVLLPAFYLPLMIMLFALIFRGIAFEFRFQARLFRRGWDYAFAAGSLLAVFAQGLVLGGFIGGVPVESEMFSDGPFSCFTVLGLLCAVGLVGGYALLGAGWLIWKTDGPTQIFGREVGHAALILTAASMALVSAWTALTVPEVAERWFAWPRILPLALMPLAAVVAIVLIWRSLWGSNDGRPFVLTIVLFLLGFGGLAVSLWPYVVPRHATVWSAASDPATLRFVGTGVLIILPIIIAYLGHAYWVFRGKTVLGAGYGSRGAELHVGRRTAASRNELHLS